VSQFQFLGHIIDNNLKDGDDIKREIKKLFCEYKYKYSSQQIHRCTHNVKLVLFKRFCMCM